MGTLFAKWRATPGTPAPPLFGLGGMGGAPFLSGLGNGRSDDIPTDGVNFPYERSGLIIEVMEEFVEGFGGLGEGFELARIDFDYEEGGVGFDEGSGTLEDINFGAFGIDFDEVWGRRGFDLEPIIEANGGVPFWVWGNLASAWVTVDEV